MSRADASPRGNNPGKFERFWNNLFTYAYDCDTFSTFVVNETFFIAAAIVLAWLCSLTTLLEFKLLAWIALAVLILGDLYFLISFYIGIQTLILARVRKRRGEQAETRSSGFARKTVEKPAPSKKPRRRNYRISNRRL